MGVIGLHLRRKGFDIGDVDVARVATQDRLGRFDWDRSALVTLKSRSED
jgi:hypothetical protein